MPLNTMWLKLKAGNTNSSSAPVLASLEVKIKDISNFERALTQLRNVMLVRHRGIEDFNMRTQEEWAEQIQRSVKNARMSGGFIAAIGLFVGGIGIMNIMLASISERVREIGIRKAVGAAGLDIFTQIIVESLVIALLGGALGLVFSQVVVWGISYATPTDNPPIITFGAMAFAFAFSAVVGIFAGLIPALKASRMHVIQALRYD
jgi:putative ABC transport system permease protein